MNAAILAVHQAESRPRRDDRSLEELIYETTRGVLRRAGRTIDDIDHIAIASSDALDGRAISSMVTAASVGDYFRDLINCSSSGEHAFIMATMQVLSGRSRLALVANWGKPSESPVAVTDNLQFDPFFYRNLRLERTALLALQARAYAEHAGVGGDVPARVAATGRARARQNPRACPRPPLTAGEIAASPEVASPLRSEELPPFTDGAVALLVGTEELARASGRPYAVIAGLGWATDSYWSGSRDLWRLPSLEAASRQAYGQAGIRDPLTDVDVVELMDVTPYHALMACEGLGLCETGAGERFAEAWLGPDAPLAVNPSGGLQASYPDFAAGLDRVAEVFYQLTGGAGGCQVPDAACGVAHATSGFAAQVNSVVVLRAAEGQG